MVPMMLACVLGSVSSFAWPCSYGSWIIDVGLGVFVSFLYFGYFQFTSSSVEAAGCFFFKRNNTPSMNEDDGNHWLCSNNASINWKITFLGFIVFLLISIGYLCVTIVVMLNPATKQRITCDDKYNREDQPNCDEEDDAAEEEEGVEREQEEIEEDEQ